MKTCRQFVKYMEVGSEAMDQQRAAGAAQFEELYAQYANDVLRMAYFYLGDRQRAEDVCQDVFIKLYTRADTIEPGKEKIVQKSAFLAAEAGVNLSVHIQKKLGAGFFGGEGFIMQKLSGYGTAFVEVDGSLLEYDLAPGQKMIIDTGYLAAMDASCTMEIQQVPGLKNKLLGGEGLFNTVVSGPGKIWIQTMPIYKVAGALMPYMPSSSN